jgi:hypothetical protein
MMKTCTLFATSMQWNGEKHTHRLSNKLHGILGSILSIKVFSDINL